MKATRTTLEWTYEPADLFEEPFDRVGPAYSLRFDAGKATVTLAAPQDPLSKGLEDEISEAVRILIDTRTCVVHRSCQLSRAPKVIQETPEGGRTVALRVGVGAVLAVGTLDVKVLDEDGRIKRDTRAQRVSAQTEFLEEVADAATRSPLVRQLLNSYARAAADPEDELTHLYEIRDAISAHYGGKDKACAELGLQKTEWDALGRLANEVPIAQGRHRGKYLGVSRPATPNELTAARSSAQRFIRLMAKIIQGAT